MGSLVGRYVLPHSPYLINGFITDNLDVREAQAAIAEICADIEKKHPDVIVVLTPHGAQFRDMYYLPDARSLSGKLKSPRGFRYSRKFTYSNISDLGDLIAERAVKMGLLAGNLARKARLKYNVSSNLDYATLVPALFIKQMYPEFSLVSVSVATAPIETQYKFGQALAEAIQRSDYRVVVVASSEFSARLNPESPEYRQQGPQFDAALRSALAQGTSDAVLNIDNELIVTSGQCGFNGLLILLGTLDKRAWSFTELSYTHPAHIGWLVGKFNDLDKKAPEALAPFLQKRTKEQKARKAKEAELVRLARESIAYFAQTNQVMKTPEGYTAAYYDYVAPVYVTIRKAGQARGFGGFEKPKTKNIIDEVISSAINASAESKIYTPITQDEVDDLIITVDILSDFEPIETVDGLDPQCDGLKVTSGFSKGVGLVMPKTMGVNNAEELKVLGAKRAQAPLTLPLAMWKFTTLHFE